MTEDLKFFMAMKPPATTHQQKASTRTESGKVIYFEPPKLRAAREKLMAHLGQHAPADPMTGPLRCMTKWIFPMTQKSVDGQWKWTRPDAHNLNKLLFDCMTACGFWKDDAQVASEIIEKFHGSVPGIYIHIQRLKQ